MRELLGPVHVVVQDVAKHSCLRLFDSCPPNGILLRASVVTVYCSATSSIAVSLSVVSLNAWIALARQAQSKPIHSSATVVEPAWPLRRILLFS